MSVRLGDTVPTRRTSTEVFAAIVVAFVLLVALTATGLHQAPAADAANHDNYVGNSSTSTARIKAHIVSPYGSVYDVWISPGADTGEGRVLHPGTRGVWAPQELQAVVVPARAARRGRVQQGQRPGPVQGVGVQVT